MYYVKSNITDELEVRVELTDENIFTVCPRCSKEVLVDFSEIFRDKTPDLYGTSVYCESCSRKIRRERKKNK